MCIIYIDPMHLQAPPIPQDTPPTCPLPQPLCPLLGFGNSRVQFIFFNPMKNIKLVICHAFAYTIQLYEMCPLCCTVKILNWRNLKHCSHWRFS